MNLSQIESIFKNFGVLVESTLAVYGVFIGDGARGRLEAIKQSACNLTKKYVTNIRVWPKIWP